MHLPNDKHERKAPFAMDKTGTSFNEQFENSFKCQQANEAMNKVKYLSLLFPMQYVGCFYCAAKQHQCQWYL